VQASDVTEGEAERAESWRAMWDASQRRVAILVAERDAGEVDAPRPARKPAAPKAAPRQVQKPDIAPPCRALVEKECFTSEELDAMFAEQAEARPVFLEANREAEADDATEEVIGLSHLISGVALGGP
jgi:hypothetical protein